MKLTTHDGKLQVPLHSDTVVQAKGDSIILKFTDGNQALDLDDIRIELDRTDLLSRYKSIPTSLVTFDKLKPDAQSIVSFVGRATYFTLNRDNHNAVYPLK